MGHAVEDADDEEQGDERREPGVVDAAAPEVAQQDPGAAGAEEAEGEEADAHGEGVGGGEAGEFEEVGCVADEVDAGEDCGWECG